MRVPVNLNAPEHATTIVEASPVGMVMINGQGEIILANEALEKLFGYTREELLGQTVEILVPEEFRSRHPGQRDGFFSDPKQRPIGQGRDLFGRHKNGTMIPVELGLTPIATDSGTVALGTVVDLTARRKAEDRFQTIVEASPVGTVIINEQGNIMLVNAALVNLFGYTREELLGQPIETLVPEELRSQHVAYRDAFLVNPIPRDLVGRVVTGRHKNGTAIQVELGLTPMSTDDGTVVLGTAVDQTARAEDAIRIRKANEALAKSNVELEQFAYIASHDLQEPLRKISSYCQLLKEEKTEALDQEGKEYVDVAIDGAKRLQTLVRDLLIFSRITTRGKPLVPTDANVSFQEAIANLELAIEERSAVITVDPLPIVLAESGQLTHLFQNLVSNAIKYCKRPVPEIACRRERSGRPIPVFRARQWNWDGFALPRADFSDIPTVAQPPRLQWHGHWARTV